MKICDSPVRTITFYPLHVYCKSHCQKQKQAASSQMAGLVTELPCCFLPFFLPFCGMNSKIQQATVCAESCQEIPSATEGLTGHGMLLLMFSTVCNSELGWIHSLCRTSHKLSWLFFAQNTESLISHLGSGQSVKQRFLDLL